MPEWVERSPLQLAEVRVERCFDTRAVILGLFLADFLAFILRKSNTIGTTLSGRAERSKPRRRCDLVFTRYSR